MTDIADQLEKLARLNADGALTDEEFARAKMRVLASEQRIDNVLTRLHRTRHERWIGGISGGLAVSTNLPIWSWRILFLLLALLHGAGVVLYVLMWIFVPLEAPDAAGPAPKSSDAA
jgi:phage shock protein C